MMSQDAIYLFCLVRERDMASPPEGTGLDRRSPLELVRFGELAALTSGASLADFTGADAEARMKEVEWLAPRALWHERVIEGAAKVSPVLPARMGTLFSSRAALVDLMARHHDRILAFLDRVAGHQEWAVKIYLDRPRAAAARAEAELRAAQPRFAASPGTRYMEEKRIRMQAERSLTAWMETVHGVLREALAGYATELVERKVLPLESDQVPGQMVANWAFLLPSDKVPDFRARVRGLDAEYESQGLRLLLTGAWPPYSFIPALDEPQPVVSP